MTALFRNLVLVMTLLAAPAARASDQVQGTATGYQSWFGTSEACVRIAPMPGAFYDLDDVDDEETLCEIDLYHADIAICPKLWSTSAAVVIYDISKGKFAHDRLGFQSEICAAGKFAEYIAEDELARIKFTMNRQETSATFSPAPILYYHLSRFFGTEVTVPVAVWRSLDARVLRTEVAESGAALTARDPELAWVHAAWTILYRTLKEPAYYRKPGTMGDYRDLLTADRERAYGVLLDAHDPRAGTVVNGAIPENWSPLHRYHLFQQTPAFVALTTDAPLDESIAAGVAGAVPPIAETWPDEPSGPAPAQMVFWMRELSETVLMDYILGQQDRPGNIDHKPYFYWVEQGQVFRKKAKGRTAGEDGIPADAVLIDRLILNDNDGAGRTEYHNTAMQMMALQRFRHFNANVYRQLLALDADFQSRGPVYVWLRDSLGLTPDQVAMIVENTRSAAAALILNCSSGALRFDLDPNRYLARGRAVAQEVPCLPGF